MAIDNRPISIRQTTSHMFNGISTDIYDVQFPLNTGVAMPTLCCFNIIPAPVSTTAIAPLQVTTNGGSMSLNVTSRTSGNFTLSEPITFNNQRGLLLDCERCVVITPQDETVNGCNFTVSGYDYRGIAIQDTVSIAAGTAAAASTNKAFSIVTGVVSNWATSTTPGVQFSLGNGVEIGLPFFVMSYQHIISLWWNLTLLTPGDSNITLGNIWRQTAPSATTDDARGLFEAPSNPNGTRQLTILYYVYGADPQLNAQLANENVSSLLEINADTNVSGNYVAPTLNQYDLIGVQYPGDNAFYTQYTNRLSS